MPTSVLWIFASLGDSFESRLASADIHTTPAMSEPTKFWVRPHMLPERIRVFLYRWFFTSLAGVSLGDWGRLLVESRAGISPRYWPRAVFITLCAAMNSMQRRIEMFRFGRKIESATVPPPLFILGHWRGGTTYLHQLLSLDVRLAAPTMVEVLFPHSILTGGPMGFFMNLFLPSRRIVDQVKLGVDEPFEDEFALAILTGRSPYLGWTFPRRRLYFDRFLALDNPADAARWMEGFRLLAAKLTLRHNKPILWKSPPHTARIRHLLELFPDARFVHIHREPTAVFASTCRLIEQGIDGLRLQVPAAHSVPDEVIERYRQMYERYFEDIPLVPPGRLVDVSYADLVNDPISTVERLYRALALEGFEELRPSLVEHQKEQRSYVAGRYDRLEPTVLARLREEWGPIVARLGYEVEG